MSKGWTTFGLLIAVALAALAGTLVLGLGPHTVADTSAALPAPHSAPRSPAQGFPPVWQIETVDSSGNVGQHTSLALDSTGRPSVSYYEGTSTSPAVLNLHTATRVYLPLVLKEH
jgi:hypothetical protein